MRVLPWFFFYKKSTINSAVKLNITIRKEACLEASSGWLGFLLCFLPITVDNTYIKFFHGIFNYLKDDYIYLKIVIIAIISLIVFTVGLTILIQHYLSSRFREPNSRDNEDRLVEKLLNQRYINDTLGFSWNMYDPNWRIYGDHLTFRDKFRIFLAANNAQREGKLVLYNYKISAIGQLRNNTRSRSLPKASFATIDLILRYA